MWDVLIAGIAFGFVGILGKWAMSLGLSPGETLAFRFVGAFSLLWVWLALTRKTHLLKISLQTLLLSLGLGIFGYAVFATFYFQALEVLSPGMASLLLYTFPVWVAMGGHLFLQEKLSLKGWSSITVAFLGTSLLVGSGMDLRASGVGILFGILSALFYAVYILVSSRFLKDVPPLISALFIQTAAGVSLALVHLRSFERIHTIFATAWFPLLLLAVIGTLVPITLFLRGLKKLRNTDASVYSTAEPLTAVIGSVLIFHETWHLTQLLGGALVLFAMILLAFAKKSGKDDPHERA